MSENPYEAAQSTLQPKRNWRFVMPIAFGLADGLLIWFGYLINSGPNGLFQIHVYANIAGLIALVLFSDIKNPALIVVNQIIFFGSGILLWILIGWIIGLYLDDRKKSSLHLD